MFGKWKHFFAWILIIAMTFNVLPMSAFATAVQEEKIGQEEVQLAEQKEYKLFEADRDDYFYVETLQVYAAASDWEVVESDYETCPEIIGKLLDMETYIGYEVSLIDHDESTPVYSNWEMLLDYDWMLYVDGEIGELAVYRLAKDGTVTKLEHEIVTKTYQESVGETIKEYTIDYIAFQSDEVGSFFYGESIATEKLASLEIVSEPTQTKYFKQAETPELNLSGLEVQVTYETCSEDGEVLLTETKELKEGEYSLAVDMSETGTQEVVVSYGSDENMVSDSFEIEIFEEQFEEPVAGVSVSTEHPGITNMKVVENHHHPAVVKAMSAITDQFRSYDITLEGYEQGEKAAVTMRIPVGFINPVIYYVDMETAKAHFIPSVVSEDGKSVTFFTDHFSTYVIAEEEGLESKSVIVQESFAAWLPAEKLENNKEYLIVSGNGTNNEYLLARNNNSAQGKNVTLKAENGISYIDSSDSAITDNAKWKAISSEGNWKFQNDSNYLSVNRTLVFFYSLQINATNSNNVWIYTDDGKLQNYNTDRYLTCSNSGGWDVDNDNGENITFYQTGTIQREVEYGVHADSIDTLAVAGDSFVHDYKIYRQQNGVVIDDDYEFAEPPVVKYESKSEISLIDFETGTYTGEEGTEIVQVTINGKTESGEEIEIYDQFKVTVKNPYYRVDIRDEADESITRVIPIKNVRAGQKYDLGILVEKDVESGSEIVENPAVQWSVGNSALASVDENGVVTFSGVPGSLYVTASYRVGNNVYEDTIVFSISDTNVVVPEDGTQDFPEYPNEGSVRFDKTATAIGSFSQTGVVQVELSMTGVPINDPVDVVLLLDMSGSMNSSYVGSGTNRMTRYDATIQAAQDFVETLVLNEDGTYNENRVHVITFHGNAKSTYSDDRIDELTSGLMSIEDAKELEALKRTIEGATADEGTYYSAGLKRANTVLADARKEEGYDRKQFVVFMSDGAPMGYTHINGSFSGTQATTERNNVYETSTGGYWTIFDYTYNRTPYKGIISAGFPKEKYSEEMKNAGVTIYTVGLGIADDSYDSRYTGTSTVYVSKEDQQKIINNISSYPNDPNYAIQVDDAAGVAALRTKFKSIATSIKYAAEDVKVEDKIKDDFTMVFDWPKNVDPVDGYEQFYIEVVDYPLDADHNRNEEQMSTLMRLYVGNNSSTGYYAADAAGNKLKDPTYSRAKDGEKAYYALENGEYVFKVNGDGTHNLTAGALVTGKDESSLVIRTPYFYYDASTRMLYWTTEKLSDSELAMRYFLYLDESAGFDAEDQVEAGTYDTNDYAYLYYRNHLGNDCRQKFPEPQVTWNGAQVSYTFYLVNEQGQPVNHAGRVVPFAEAVYVTDVFTHAITWNDVDETTSLDAVLEAQKLLPEVYELYDEKTAYTIHVFEDENGSDINNHFKIDATTDTTYVFNTKADAIKYTKAGIYGPKAKVNCKEYSENGADGEDNLGKYDWVTKDATVVKSGFDFANTTVAFAVVWKPELRPDTVVIDFGLPVVIDVAQNDSLVGDVVGVRSEAPVGITMNTGQYSVDSQKQRRIEAAHGTAYVDGIDAVRYVPKNMEFDEPDVFYYESEVGIVHPDTLSKEYYTMYSSVTVIPATSIYYEDRFVQLESGVSADESTYGTWIQVSDGGEEIKENGQGWNVVGATQAVDRPGPDKIGQAFDADNIYGYDGAYDDCTKYSMGSSKKVTVNAQNNPSKGGKWPTATFTFTGTDFDIIGLSSNKTGILCVTVTGGNIPAEQPIQWIVDTYYGYQYVEGTDGEEGSWEVVENGPNTLYQVPVIKSNLGTYGTYTVTLEVRYGALFDHSKNGEYDFYLDAIRVYNPAKNNKDIQDVYVQDSEYEPTYYEVRNHLIGQNAFSGLQGENASSAGIVFIDGKGSMNSVADYTNYGPNNEVYLTNGQAINFVLSAQAEQGLYNRVHMAMKSVGAATTAAIYKVSTDSSGNGEKELVDKIQLNTSTDLYYDMTPLLGQSIIVENCSAEGILSLTNVKVACGTEEVDVIEEEWVSLEEPAVFAVSRRSVDAALYAMNRQDVQEPEEKPENTVSVTEHFSDVKDDWYTSSVQYVFDKQIMKGISGTNEFQPSKEISRAEIAQILYNLEGKPERKNEEIFDMFKDVNSDAWYADAVSWAYEHNIIKGDRTEQRFSPNDSATREQVAQILYRYAAYKGYDVSQTSDLENLLNVEKVSSWASAGVAWAVGAGVIKGVTNVEESGVKCYDLAPQGIVTRAQAATMMMRFCEKYQQ